MSSAAGVSPSQIDTSNQAQGQIPDVARTHYFALRKYLTSYLQKEQQGVSSQRQSAREKLTKLFPHQFEELSTDVYDEMMRRQSGDEVPFLPLQSEYHPKRNQARQKLATLSPNRFKDLASDVHAELERRYSALKGAPEVQEDKSVSNILPEQTVAVGSPKLNDKDDAKDVMGMVNFQSLDNLMADLGSMIAGGTDDGSNAQKAETVQEKTIAMKKSVEKLNSTPLASTSTNESTVSAAELKKLQDQLRLIKEESDKSKAESQAALREAAAQVSALKEQNKLLQADLASKNPEKYIAQITSLESKITQLENDKKNAMDRVKTMEMELKQAQDDLRTEQKLGANFKTEIKNLQLELDSSKKALEAAKAETDKQLSNQQMSMEAKFENLKRDHSNLKMEREEKDNKIKSLTAEVEKLKAAVATSTQQIAQLEQSRGLKKSASLRVSTGGRVSLRSPPATNGMPTSPSLVEDFTNIPSQIDINSPTLLSDSGLVDIQDVLSFKSSILELLKAGRADTPAGVLIAMKSIVVATRSISETVETYESTSQPPLSAEELDRTSLLRNQLSTHLTALMTAAKNHATGVGGSNVSLLDRAAYDLVTDILGIIKLIKLRRDSNDSPPMATDKKSEASRQALDSLKVFLEQQTDLIVQNIQVLLQAMRQNSFDSEFKDTITNITTVVNNLTSVSKDTLEENSLSSKQKERGLNILQLLSESNSKLSAMGVSMVSSDQKPSKQKLAAAAYEVAKFTKELVSLFDSE